MAKYPHIGDQTAGVWLVERSGKGAVLDYKHLPKEGQGFQYYYLGNTPEHAMGNLLDAAAKLGVGLRAGSNLDLHPAFQSGQQDLPGPRGGLLGWLLDAFQAGAVLPFTGGLNPGAATGEGGAAGGAAGGEAGGAGAAGGAAGTIAKVAGAASVSALLVETGLWKGIGLVLAGAILIYLALKQFGINVPTPARLA